MGRDVQPALRIAPLGRTARPRGLFRPALAQENFPGCDARVYFNPDVPGRALQMQQILSKSGHPLHVISRYHEGFYRWAEPGRIVGPGLFPRPLYEFFGAAERQPEEAVKAILPQNLSDWSPYYEKRNIPPEFPLLHSEDFSKPTDFGR